MESVNQDVSRFLRSYCQDRPGECAAFIPWAEMVQNSLRHSSTNLSPFQCVLVCVGVSAGSGTLASEADRSSCGPYYIETITHKQTWGN